MLIPASSSLIVTRMFPHISIKRCCDLDTYRHFKRVLKYARPSDYAAGAALGALGPGLMLMWEKIAPSHVGRGGFAPIMRLSGVLGVAGGFLMLFERSTSKLRRLLFF